MIENTIQKLYACRKKETELLIEILAELIEKIEQETEIVLDSKILESIVVHRYEKRITVLEKKIEQLQAALSK